MTSAATSSQPIETPELLPATLTRAGIIRGARLGVPLALGTIPWSMAFGVLSRDVELTSIQTLFMSFLIYSGTAQMVAIDFWQSNGGMFGIWTAMLLINLRYVMFGLVTRRWFQEIAPFKTYLTLFYLGDQSWAVMLNERREGRRDIGVFVGCNLMLIGGWMAGTILGRFAGSAIPDPERWGLSFLATAALISLLAGMWKGKPHLVPWLVAAAASIVAQQMISGPFYVLIGAGLGTFAAVAQERWFGRG